MKKTGLKVLAGIVSAAVISACASGAASPSSGASAFLSSVSWDAEYDVVVAGFGGAGATSAVTAADAGAKVLLLEKAAEGEEGGNTKYAMQSVIIPADRAAEITYFKGLRGYYGNQSDEVINFIVDGSMENRAWFEKMGLDMKKINIRPTVEYPELEGGKAGNANSFVGAPFQSGLWQFLRGLVYDRKDKIDVWYSSPAVKLIQDKATGIIHGVVVARDGKNYNVRAKNGVVLASGGFENNDDMLENYAQLGNATAMGARHNTGDGIRMAMDVGADLWHMSALSGPYLNFINPDTGNAMFVLFNSPAKSAFASGFGATSMIVVGGNGRRFINEIDTTRHGHVNVGGTYFSQLIPNNSYCVFDEAARTTAPAYPQWSSDMSEEIKKGWIIQASSIGELAAKMKVDPAALESEIQKYNQFCRSGSDPEFHRNPKCLKPLETGPYYAFSLRATLINTQGGPRRNAECEVLDVWGKPIPRLYSAGELGSFYPDLYQGGGNLSECLFTGRKAGSNAASLKKDSVAASVMGGRTPVDFRTQAAAVISAGAGETLGTGPGLGGDLTVRVKREGSRIVSVEVVKHSETPGISDRALAIVPASIVEKQNADVDIVTGATITSRAIIAAVKDALSK